MLRWYFQLLYYATVVALCLPVPVWGQTALVKANSQSDLIRAIGRVPLYFEANQGQAPIGVRFLSRSPGYTILLGPGEVVLRLVNPGADSGPAEVRLSFKTASPTIEVRGEAALPGRVNYFLGNDPQKWRSNVPTYARVRYRSVYPGVDVLFYGHQRRLEFDLLLEPWVHPETAALVIQGTEHIKINDIGDLVLTTAAGPVLLRAPTVYQETGGQRKRVAASYVIREGGEIGFQVGTYDHSQPLVIDPVLEYSTYLGGNNVDWAVDVAVDREGCAYILGTTSSSDFPTANAYDGSFGGGVCSGDPCSDVFVTKLDPAGSTLLYSTYLGGDGPDVGHGLAVDVHGNAYIGGFTDSSDFPTVNAYSSTLSSTRDIFVAKLNAAGSALLYSSYFGGSETDYAYDINADQFGFLYVIFNTHSLDVPTLNGFMPSVPLYSAQNAFVAKFDPSKSGSSSLVYATYLGGDSTEHGEGIALDWSGNVYVTGNTHSTNFPTKNAFQGLPSGDSDVFATKIDPSKSGQDSLVYSTYLGGSDYERGFDIRVDPSGQAYVVGNTWSGDYPTANAYQGAHAHPGTDDVFVTKLNQDGSGLVYSTYLGGTEDDRAYGVFVDQWGRAHVTGRTDSSDFPVFNAYQSYISGVDCDYGQCRDGFVTVFDPGGQTLLFSTYLGGGEADLAKDLAVDQFGGLYLAGYSNSSDFPATANAFQRDFVGGDCDGSPCEDAFFVKMRDIGLSQAATQTAAFPAATTAEGFRMASAPLQLNNPLFSAAFGLQSPRAADQAGRDEAGVETYDTTRMRIGYWDGASQSYVEYPDFEGTMMPGWAGWFLFGDGKTLTFCGKKTMGNYGQTYAVTLYSGWNQLGNPFDFTVDPNQILVTDRQTGAAQYLTSGANIITQKLFWIYTSGDYSATTTLTPGSGGWLKKLTSGPGAIIFPPIQAGSPDRVSDQVLNTEGLDRPPEPPGGLTGTGASGAGTGGGGGGCFVITARD